MEYSDFLKKVNSQSFIDVNYQDKLTTLNYLIEEEKIIEFYLKFKDREVQEYVAYIFEEDKLTIVTFKEKSVQFDVNYYKNIIKLNLNYLKDGWRPSELTIDFGYTSVVLNSEKDYFKKESADKRIAYIYKLLAS